MNFPNCCTAHILLNFAQGNAGDSGGVPCRSVEDAEKWITAQVKYIKQSRHALITVITNNQQDWANEALENLGFEHSKWIEKEQHADTQDRLWWADMNRFTLDGILKKTVRAELDAVKKAEEEES